MIKTSPKVQELRRKIYSKAKAERQHRFWGLYVHVCKMELLYVGYHMAKANGGAAGVDGTTFEDIEKSGHYQFMSQLQQDLKDQTYKASPNRIVEIPKADGKVRKLGIPTIRDRVVQNAIRLVLEPVFETDFQDGSYGYRPDKKLSDATERVAKAIAWEKTLVIDLDLKSYFDTIRHHILLDKLAKRINDDKLMHLLKLILKTGGRKGVPQGGTLSPLLSNIYLNELDMMLEKAKQVTMKNGYPVMEYTRFADDLIVQISWRRECSWLVKGLDKRLREELAKLQVEINEEKTKYVNMARKQTFDFLGFTYSRKRRLNRKAHPLHIPKKAAVKKILMDIKTLFKKHISRPLEEVVDKLNPILRGWVNYYRTGNSNRKFSVVRNYLMQRVRRHLMRAKKRRGFGWKRWSTAELVKMYKIYDDYHIVYGKVLPALRI
jgi:RNA-directed DNA polymerase